LAQRVCLRLRKANGVAPENVVIPVDTVAGEVAQVDFGNVGQLYDPAEGRMRKAWIFVMVLAFSRLMVVRVVFDQKTETWLRCHAEAFAELGGVPKVVVPDSLHGDRWQVRFPGCVPPGAPDSSQSGSLAPEPCESAIGTRGSSLVRCLTRLRTYRSTMPTPR
jgi:transposase